MKKIIDIYDEEVEVEDDYELQDGESSVEDKTEEEEEEAVAENTSSAEEPPKEEPAIPEVE